MKTCIKCGKSGEDLWMSKSGFCEDCAESVSKAQAQAEMRAHQQEQPQAQHAPARPQQVNSALPGMFNVWFGLCITCLVIGFICLFAISFGGGFQYVGGDAYNVQITATLATGWFILSLICAVVGCARYLGEVMKYRK